MLNNLSSLYGDNYSQWSAVAQYGALAALPGVARLSQTGGSGSVVALNRQESSYQVKLSAYGKLKSALDTYSTALNGIKSAQDAAPYKAISGTGNDATLTATASKDTAAAGSYAVNVSQLAKAQTLKSGVYADKDATIIGTGSITLQTGGYDAITNAFTSAGSGKTISISASNGTLSGIANAINAAGAGVKASVEQSSGGYRLSLTSAQTGTDNSIKLTVADNDNANGDLVGLSAFAYNPSAGPSGYGKNLSETVAAQNARLTVNAASITSQSNDVTSAVTGITFSLAATGTATVDVARDSATFAASAQKFVDAYNALQKSVGELSQSSSQNTLPPLANDGLTTKIGGDLRNIAAQASYGYGSDKTTLSDIGITKQSNGTLALDKTKLQSAFAANPDNAAKLLATTADKLSSATTRATGDNSELQYTTRGLSRALQSTQNNKTLLQNYTAAQTYFGLPAQPPLSSYISKFNTNALAGRYSQISGLH